MKKLISLAFLVALCIVPASAYGDCDGCKCTEYPVPSSCTKCCGVITGKVTAYSESRVAVASVKGTRDLHVTAETVVRGRIREGDTVTVVYNKETKEAGLIKGN